MAAPRSLLATVVAAAIALWASACGSEAMAPAQRGALVGGLAGVAAGGTVGVLISDEQLLGSSSSEESGDVALPRTGSIAAGVLVGAVVGTVVGAMAGHRAEDRYKMPERQEPVLPEDSELDAAISAGAQRAARSLPAAGSL
ncbi:MAG: hypothetical protein OEZ06_27105 [Myxococcales bacterium]|nr:hypothetical protein [Myxococcales bacterium]